MTVGNMSSIMKVSDLTRILEGIKKMYGDLPIWGQCAECTTSDLYVWVLTSDSENFVTIQVSGIGEDDV